MSSIDDTEVVSFKLLNHHLTVNNTPTILLDNLCDPDLNFFNISIQDIETPYIFPEEFHKLSKELTYKIFQLWT